MSGVGVRTITVGSLPLLVAAVPAEGPAASLVAAVADRGLPAVPGLSGVDLPRGARLGFVLDRDELRLVDERETTLLRAPRAGLDAGWLEAAVRLRGTMTAVVTDVTVDAATTPAQVVAALDAAGADGRLRGAIVGLAEERPTLPLLLT